MQPRFSEIIWGRTAWMAFRAPPRFTPRYRSHSSSVMSWNRHWPATPALFTSSSTGPRVSAAARTISFTAARSETSARKAMAMRPSPRRRSTSSSAACRCSM